MKVAKKNVARMTGYTLVFFLLAKAEKEAGITGFGIGLSYALLYCKENPFLFAFSYFLGSGLVHFSGWAVLFSGVATLPLFILFLLHKRGKKYRLLPVFFIILFCQSFPFVFFHASWTQIILRGASVAVGGLFFYVCVIALYPLYIRGIRYKRSKKEVASFALLLAPIGAGLYFYWEQITFFYTVVFSFVLLFSLEDNGYFLYALALGAGASFFHADAYPCFACVALSSGYFLFSSVHRHAGALASVLFFVGTLLLFDRFSWYEIAPIVTPLPFFWVPENRFSFLFSYKESAESRFALRTVINRDRDEIGKKLETVAYAFEKVQKLLIGEESYLPRERDITAYLERKFCRTCPQIGDCRMQQSYGSGLSSLVETVQKAGKVSLLDASAELSENCPFFPKMVGEINVIAEKMQAGREKKKEVDAGREMIICELGGTATLLKKLADGLEAGYGFDTATEKRALEELSYADIVATDIAIYGKGKEGVTVTVRECDADKKQLPIVLSSVMGEKLTETERKNIPNGMVGIRFHHASLFGVLYGESSSGLEEHIGDTKHTVKLGHDKLMFALSDGMGTGEEAEKTSARAIDLLESFYKAGFDHKTVFGCVSQLLALRKKEDFSALDIAIIDTQTGEFDFIKQGGRESYLYTENGLEVIEGGSLPLGIIEGNEPQITTKKMQNGDLVIMMSDGVADRLRYADVCEFLATVKTTNPQVLAEKLVAFAKSKEGKEDDMTVLVIRVLQNRRNVLL